MKMDLRIKKYELQHEERLKTLEGMNSKIYDDNVEGNKWHIGRFGSTITSVQN